jgi:pyridoxal phosphate enzyme (YggS family)
MIKENLAEVERRISEAAARCGRKRDEITLVAVSKTKPVSMIEEAMGAGVLDFGENKPQELRDKYGLLPGNLRWHMIGNLQRNKVKYIIDKAVMIHSVGSLELAETIEREAEKHQLVMPILLEVNMAREASKGGVMPEDAQRLAAEVAKFPHLSVRGLMTIAPMVERAEENRVHFRNLRNLSIDISSKNIDNVAMCELSMGMTGDYEIAVEEGATLIRVGTGIFGERDYTKTAGI